MVMSSQSTGGGTVTVKDGAGFGVDRDTPYVRHLQTDPTLNLSSLTLGSSAGAKIRFTLRDGNSAVPTLSTDSLTLKGINQIEIEGGNFAIGQFPLIKYATQLGSGSLAYSPAKLPWGVEATIVNNTANKTIDLVVTAIPPNRSAAKTSMRIDEASDYRSYPDAFPVTKMDGDMFMARIPVAQRVFDTAEACIAAPDNKVDDYSISRFIGTVRDLESDGWHVSSAWIFREDAKHRPGAGEFEEDLRVLSATELTNLRAGIANSALRSKDVKLIQLMGGNNVGGVRKNWFELSDELRTHLLSFDGIGTEMHVGDSDQGNEEQAARRILLLQEMAAITKWAKDNGKIALNFMGGNEATYSSLKATQHTYASLWREMLRLGVNYRAENLIYVRQGAHADGDVGGLAGKHVPESDFDSLTYQQQWVIRALKDTSLFITANNSVSMTADTTARLRVVAGKAECYPLTYTARSSNQSLIPDGNLSFIGRNDGLDHVLSITPNPGQSGGATITMTVTDGVDTRTRSFELTVTPAISVPAVAGGWINSSSTWGGTLPVAGDTQTWQTGARAINMSGQGADTFLGSTLEVQTGGSFSPGLPSANLTLNNLTLSGGLIAMNNNVPLRMNLQFNQFTLNGGTIRSGGSENMDVYFLNLILGGSGKINITSAGTGASIVEFGDGVNTMGFTGTFKITSYGRLNLPHIIPDKASFGLEISGTGRYINDAAVAVTSLTLDGEVIPPGTYTFADFTPAQKAFIGNNGGTITVVSSTNAPLIGNITDKTLNEDEATPAIPLTVGDIESAATALTITKTSSNTSLVPVANIVLDGTGINRTVTVTPAANQSGTATITLTVSDGVLATSQSFIVTVNPVNDLPTISDIPNITITEGDAPAAIPFTVGDLETDATALTVTKSSSNQSLVPNENISLGGTGVNRTVTITPVAGGYGTATITLTVTDGENTASDSFLLTVTPLGGVSIANGSLTDSASWNKPLPLANDTDNWAIGNHILTVSGGGASVLFEGQTLILRSGGILRSAGPGPVLTLNNLMLVGGSIENFHNGSFRVLLGGKTLTLDGGALASGAVNSARDLRFENGSLAGSGTIVIQNVATTGTASGSEVDFTNTINTQGFDGVFDVKLNGVLNLPPIAVGSASFGIAISGTGKYWNDAAVAVRSLTIAGHSFPNGTYTFANIGAAYQSFVGNNGGTITVATDTPLTFGSWALANADANHTPDMDHDNDGVANGIEYLMGQTGSTVTPLPRPDATGKISWPLSPDFLGTFAVQTSTNLSDWTTQTHTVNGNVIEYTLPSSQSKVFVRLVVNPQ
jgi:hypothetical protein